MIALDLCVGVLVLATLVRFSVEPRTQGDWRAWIDLSHWPSPVGRACFLAFSASVIAWPILPRSARGLVRTGVFVAALICAADSFRYWSAMQQARIAAGWPIPLSLPTALALGAWSVWASAPSRRPRGRRASLTILGTAIGGLVALGVFVHGFGATDYRRHADAVVVFGAQVDPDGTPSLSLADRTRTGCELLLEDLAPTIVYSGGRDVGNRLSEPESMYELGTTLGIYGDRAIFDEEGVNTQATISNVARLAREEGWRSVLLVSHDYHLARIKMFAERAGLCAYTVPATETRPLARRHWFFVRELAAIGYYWFEPLIQHWR